MKNLLQNFGSVQIYEETKDNRVNIYATNHTITKPLTTYYLSEYNNNDNRKNFFRAVALSYYKEIKREFEAN